MPANSVAENVLGTSKSFKHVPLSGSHDDILWSRHGAVDGADHTSELEELAGALHPGALCLFGVRIARAFSPRAPLRERENARSLWSISAIFLGVYNITQNINIPLIIQPQLFGFFCAFSWTQVGFLTVCRD